METQVHIGRDPARGELNGWAAEIGPFFDLGRLFRLGVFPGEMQRTKRCRSSNGEVD